MYKEINVDDKSLFGYMLIFVLLLTFLTGCKGGKNEQQEQRRIAEDMVYAAYKAKDYPRIITLVDSFKTDGNFSEGKACYWLGYAYDRMMQKRMAELYWRTGIAAVSNSTEDEDIRVYAGITNRLTDLLNLWSEYEAALKVAVPAVERLRSLECDTTNEYINMLICIGCCQSRFGLGEEKVDEDLEEGYRAFLHIIKKHPYATNYRDAIIGVINICYTFLEEGKYEKTIPWLDRFGKLIEEYTEQEDARTDYADKQWARYHIYSAWALEGLGRKEEAAKAYREFCQTKYFQTTEGKIVASNYLELAGLWQEAADNFRSMETLMREYGIDYSLESLQKMLIRKYEINKKAGRKDSARAVSVEIVEHLDSAITLARLAEVREATAVHQKELEITAENEHYQRQRQIWRMIGMMTTILFLLIYIIIRHRTQRRLTVANALLEQKNEQLVEANARAEESAKMKSNFIQQISHEIRTPLNILSGFTQIVTTPGMELDDETKQDINRQITENTDRITGLVNKMLELSDANSKTVLERTDHVSAIQIAAQAVEASGISMAQHLTFDIQIAPEAEDTILQTNLTAATRALTLLLDNAQKFTQLPEAQRSQEQTEKKEQALLKVAAEEGKTLFVVEDTGIGVPVAESEHIFEVFVQLNDYYDGTGIGLTVARSLARRLGGDVSLDTSYTGGARFLMTLPQKTE